MSGTVRTISQLLAQFASGQTSGSIDPADEQDFIATMNDLTSAKITPTIQTGTGSPPTYTFVLADASRCVLMNNAAANNLVVPPNSSVPFVVGQLLPFWQIGAGTTTLVAGSGVTLLPGPGVTLAMRGQRTFGTIYQYTANTWLVSGDFT